MIEQLPGIATLGALILLVVVHVAYEKGRTRGYVEGLNAGAKDWLYLIRHGGRVVHGGAARREEAPPSSATKGQGEKV